MEIFAARYPVTEAPLAKIEDAKSLGAGPVLVRRGLEGPVWPADRVPEVDIGKQAYEVCAMPAPRGPSDRLVR